MELNPQRNEITQFLSDVRDHFRASLETSEYENTSNMFHMTAAEGTEKLLQRCEQLLMQYTPKQLQQHSANKGRTVNGMEPISNGISDCIDSRTLSTTKTTTTTVHNKETMQHASVEHEDPSYLDMTANNKKTMGSREYNDFNKSIDSDKTFRCSTRLGDKRSSALHDGGNTTATDEDDSEHEVLHDDNDDIFDEDPQIYDICHVSDATADETQKAITPDLEFTQSQDCPYAELPAGHLAIQKSSKYGQLQRIEKRLFFDQSKKCYCGILNDWLLCYADGPTASRPSITLHLKSNGIDIEHSGEGKRRDICFQITTADPNKKFTFQANNEVDAKEWIHAIEAAIRGDTTAIMKNARKLPTPPVMKKMSFISCSNQRNGYESTSTSNGDCIYEEPSPLYHIHEPTELLISNGLTEQHTVAEKKPPELPDKHNSSIALALKYEYDVPKCPPQPFKIESDSTVTEVTTSNTTETAGLLNHSDATTKTQAFNDNQKSTTTVSAEQLDFQNKVKDVHSKLTSQLSSGLNSPERLKKAAKKTYSGSSQETEAIALTTSPPNPTSKEQKKQKKSNTPNASPQKNSNANAGVEKSTKNWFLNRLNKSTSSARNSALPTPTKCKQSEKENLLNSLELCDNYEAGPDAQLNSSSNPTSPIMKSSSAKSKVNMIIDKFEASGHLASMFSVEALAGNALATFSSFCDSDCNNYEPIMTVSTPPSSFMKKV